MASNNYLSSVVAAINECIGSAQVDPEVTTGEYNQLVDIQALALHLQHKAWARKTFRETTK